MKDPDKRVPRTYPARPASIGSPLRVYAVILLLIALLGLLM